MKKSVSRNALALAVLLSMGAAIPTTSHAGTFSDSLTNGLDTNSYTVSIGQSAVAAYKETASSSGIQLAKIGSTSGFEYIAVNLNLSALGGNVTGDFSVQVDFDNAVVGPNNDQVQLNASFADGSIFYDVYDLSAGLNVHVWDGSTVQNPHSVTGTSGTFVISRTGSTVTGSYNGITLFSNSNATALNAINFSLQNQPGAANDSSSVTFRNFSLTASTVTGAATPAFFSGQTALSQGVYYLAFPGNGNIFGYYEFLSDPHYIYHFDLGFEYVFDAGDGHGGVYFYDFKSGHFLYTSPTFPFPYLYDFTLQTFLYYYPDPTNPQRYNTNGVRYFFRFDTGQTFSM